MAALIQHPSSQALCSDIALTFRSLCGHHVTSEIKFKLLGRHSRTLTILLQLSKLLPPTQLISSLFLYLRNPRHSSTPKCHGTLPRRAMFPHYPAFVPADSSARNALSLCHHLAPAAAYLRPGPLAWWLGCGSRA